MEKKLELMIKAIEDKNGKGITALKLLNENRVFDFVVLATGSSNKNIQAISDGIEDELEVTGVTKLRSEGYSEADWILLDYDDILVHIFDREVRDFYNLEELYSESEVLYRS